MRSHNYDEFLFLARGFGSSHLFSGFSLQRWLLVHIIFLSKSHALTAVQKVRVAPVVLRHYKNIYWSLIDITAVASEVYFSYQDHWVFEYGLLLCVPENTYDVEDCFFFGDLGALSRRILIDNLAASWTRILPFLPLPFRASFGSIDCVRLVAPRKIFCAGEESCHCLLTNSLDAILHGEAVYVLRAHNGRTLGDLISGGPTCGARGVCGNPCL